MAPQPSSHIFQKLKLDTSAPHKRVSSTFDSIPRPDSIHAQSQDDLEHVEGHKITDGPFKTRHHNGSHGHIAAYEGGVGRSLGRTVSNERTIEDLFRRRKTSISFDNEVQLDTGDVVGLEVPVPKPSARQSPSYTPEEGSYSEGDYLEMPFNSRRALSRQATAHGRYPLLQTTVDEMATDPEYNDQVASLTSEATASPLEEARTPIDARNEYMLSPLPSTSSPLEFPLFSPMSRGPTRNRSFRTEISEDGSLRRASRRSSGRSGRSLSSMSPAASFLARYKASEAPLREPQPDDEGQGLGYDNEYIIGKQIGYGGFSIVKEVTSMENGKPVVDAVKIVRKQQSNKSEFENEALQSQFDHEVEMWRFLRHPYILPLIKVYTTDYATFCITKLNKGGTLFDLIRDTRRQQKVGLSKQLVKRYAYQLASALRYLHNDVCVVHRDVKLENCLLDMTAPDAATAGGDVLLCDFGMADFIVRDDREGPEPHSSGQNPNIGPADTSTSVQGSLQYAAPELFSSTGAVMFSPAADIWAFGVVLYALLTATLPFNEGLDAKTTTKILNGEWDQELVRTATALQDGGAEEALTLLKGCLNMDAEQRWTVSDILDCCFLRDCADQYEGVSRSWTPKD
ncbi:kinase-like domain-containing protein [Boeremia exigua]|uniref:kinase-like domain-containing protein n=1 Tax=Boeremia exigua TaxID=749465 RepID=UPI001E8E5A7D|nr:kinase-like domain-containing protein [Boeremia exigua]KAH6642115.1 kinase-like domain-containing protein [Boeremia exigua]